MQLLPSNSSLREQKFASFLDEMAKEDYDVLSICPLECKASLLPHLALWLRVDISDLEESEAREYIKKAIQTKTKKGTVGAVEEVLKSIFSEAVLKEWFEDDSLKKGEFKAHLTIKPDPSLKYGEKKFEAIKRLINQTKNVRSHFAGFDVKMPLSVGKYNYIATNSYTINLSNELKNKELNKSLDFKTATTTTISLNNRANQDFKSDVKITLKKGGVVDVSLENDISYISDKEIDFKLIGGVVWEL